MIKDSDIRILGDLLGVVLIEALFGDPLREFFQFGIRWYSRRIFGCSCAH